MTTKSGRKTIKVREYRKSIGRQCMHCGRPATVTGVAIVGEGKWKFNVRYCRAHAIEMGALQAEGDEEE